MKRGKKAKPAPSIAEREKSSDRGSGSKGSSGAKIAGLLGMMGQGGGGPPPEGLGPQGPQAPLGAGAVPPGEPPGPLNRKRGAP